MHAMVGEVDVPDILRHAFQRSMPRSNVFRKDKWAAMLGKLRPARKRENFADPGSSYIYAPSLRSTA
jgi:hypothetical protein